MMVVTSSMISYQRVTARETGGFIVEPLGRMRALALCF